VPVSVDTEDSVELVEVPVIPVLEVATLVVLELELVDTVEVCCTTGGLGGSR
jgi:hypothetical protein